MKKPLLILITLLLSALLYVGPAYAQQSTDFTLGLSRDFGYGGFGNDIQGLFSMKITQGAENVNRVVFMIDDQVMFDDSEPPFKVQFSTDNYPLGLHTLSAIGYTPDGQELHSNQITAEFVSAEAGWKAALKIVVPLLAIIFGVMVLSFAIPVLLARRRKSELPLGAPRNYGLRGGAICPKCHRPFALHFFAPNLLLSKLDICPHCGKWSIVRPASRADLEAAEAAEAAMSTTGEPVPEETDEEKLRKELEDSRYHDA
jgi:hypothetical protein